MFYPPQNYISNLYMQCPRFEEMLKDEALKELRKLFPQNKELLRMTYMMKVDNTHLTCLVP